MKILQPPNWPRPKGYANGVAARGRQVFIAGRSAGTSTAASTATISRTDAPGLAEHRCRAGGERRQARAHRAHDLVRDQQARVPRCRTRDRQGLSRDHRRHYPAMTAVEVAALIEDGAKVEIEATAVIPD